MKNLRLWLVLLPLLLFGFGAKAASPTFQQFFGTNGIRITTNGNVVQVDGMFLTNGASAIYITTNLFVYESTYTSNLYATNIYVENFYSSNIVTTNIFVDQFIQVSNIYMTNLTVENISISTNLTVQNIVTTNIFVNQSVVVSNVYVTNLYANTIIGKDILWTNDNGTVRLIDETRVGIGTNAGDALWLLERGTNAINALSYTTNGVLMAMIDSNGNWYAQGMTSGAAGMALLTTNSATTFAYGFSFVKRGTTGNAAAAITAGSELGNTFWKGWDGSAYGIGGTLVLKTEQDWSGANYGSHWEFRLAPSNSVTGIEGMRLVAVNGTNSMLTFVGTTASFPALKRFGTELQLRLADNSGFAGLTASNAQFAGPVAITGNLAMINGAAQVWPSANAAGALTNDGSGNFGWNAVVGGASASLGMIRSNIFTTNIQGSPVVGTLWLQGTTGTAVTNGARTTLEYVPSKPSLRIGVIGAENGTVSTSTYSNYWDGTNVGISTVGFGSNTMVRGHYSSVMGGALNVIETNALYNFIGGGYKNVINSNVVSSVVVGGTNNVINTALAANTIGNFLGGGDGNIMDAGVQYAVLGGGLANRIRTQYSFLGAGTGNDIRGYGSVIAGGVNNVVVGTTPNTTAVLGGGEQNSVGGKYSSIGGGNLNTISTNSIHAFIGSGFSNVIDATQGVIAGGQQNLNQGTACSIGGGILNIGNGNYGVVAGGFSNTIGSFGAVISGGQSNIIGATTAFRAIIGGGSFNIIGTTAEGAHILGGTRNTATAVSSMVFGNFITNATASTIRMGFFDTNAVVIDQLGLKVEGLSKTRSGKGTAYANMGGTISANTTSVISAGTGETNLMTYTVPAHTLTNSGDRLIIRASGRLATTANAKQIKLVWGSETVFDTGSQIVNGGSWVIEAEIIRTGATSQTINGNYNGAGETLFNLAGCRDIAQTNGIDTVLKLTGTSGADGDLTNKTMTVEWRGAP